MEIAPRREMVGRLIRLVLVLLLAYGPMTALAGSGKVQHATMRGVDMTSYGRLILSFEHLPKYDIKIANGILIWKFDEPVDVNLDRLAIELPSYIAGARLDPDRKALRLALQQPVTSNVQDAGNDLYLDLLPSSYKGAYPSLPNDIVRDLSRRAREAEAQLQLLQKKPASPLSVDFATSRATIVLRLRPVVASDSHVTSQDGLVTIRLNGSHHIENADWSRALPNDLKLQSVDEADDHLEIVVKYDPALRVHSYYDEHILIVEFARQKTGSNVPDYVTPDWDGNIQTGSIAPDQLNRLAADKEDQDAFRVDVVQDGPDPVLTFAGVKDVPRAIFADDKTVYCVFETPDPVKLSDRAKAPGSPISKIDIVTVGLTRILAVRLVEDRHPVIKSGDDRFLVALRQSPDTGLSEVGLVSHLTQRDERRALIALNDVEKLVSFDDPETGSRYHVATSHIPNLGFGMKRNFPEFAVLSSAEGVAIQPLADDLDVRVDIGVIVISRPGRGLNLSLPHDEEKDGKRGPMPVLRSSSYRRVPAELVQGEIRKQIDYLNRLDPAMRATSRLKLARFYAAQDLFKEAAAMMELVIADRGPGKSFIEDELERAFYNSLAGRHGESLSFYTRSDLAAYSEVALFLAYDLASLARFEEAMVAYRRSDAALAQYPSELIRKILPVMTEAAIEARDVPTARNLVAALQTYRQGELAEIYRYLTARLADLVGPSETSTEEYQILSRSLDPAISVRAKQALLLQNEQNKTMSRADLLADYDGLSLIWRGDFIEARSLSGIVRNAFAAGDWRRGFVTLRRLNQSYSDLPGIRPLLDQATAQMEALFDGPDADKVGSIDAVSLFMDFREFSPVGRRGDDLIRRLADRLVSLDLLPQAAELMRYQLTYRIEGSAKAAAAPKLAFVLLRDHKPKDALQVLSETRMNGVDPVTQRSRLLLEARARADLGDTDGALESIADLQGEDADRLLAELAWRAKQWQNAAEWSERVIGDHWREGQPWSDDVAHYALRAAIGFALSDDRLALDRLRGRFTSHLSERPEAQAFRFLTAPATQHAPLTSEYAAQYPGGSAIDGFMTYYQNHYLKSSADPQPDAGKDKTSG